MHRSLHRRLLFWLFSVVVVTTVIVMVLFIKDANRRVASFSETHAIHQAHSLSEASRDALVTEDYGFVNSLVMAALPDSSYSFASIVLADGKVISHTDIDKIGHTDTIKYNGTGGHELETVLYSGKPVQVVTMPVIIANETLGYAKVAYDIDANTQLDRETIDSILKILLLMLSFMVIGSYFVTRLIVKPINRLTSMVSEFDIQRDELRIETDIWQRKDEVGKLARAFKLMQMEVVEYVEKLRVEIDERRKADTANQSKSDFLANMSHELRTPLNAIIGYSEMLIEEAADNGDHDAQDLRKIRSAGIHLLQLINNLLDLSKIEAGKMELACADMYVPDLITEVANTIASQVAQKGNTLKVTIEEDVGHGFVDAIKVKQMLFNLLGNAAKFTRNGEIEVHVYMDRLTGSDHFMIEVIDQGVGMTQEQCDRIFQPYVQAESSTSNEFGGTGLGLTITKKFCEMMGGEINVSSVLGAGTTFTVTLPVNTLKKAASA